VLKGGTSETYLPARLKREEAMAGGHGSVIQSTHWISELRWEGCDHCFKLCDTQVEQAHLFYEILALCLSDVVTHWCSQLGYTSTLSADVSKV
jgi:hypothetical protein